jgi:hypothetical protein
MKEPAVCCHPYSYGPVLYSQVTTVKPDINPIRVHPKLSHNMLPVDGALVAYWRWQPNYIVVSNIHWMAIYYSVVDEPQLS